MALQTGISLSTKGSAYAGIGSRQTPPELLELMAQVAGALAAKGWILRTGMAAGADQAFYRGASEHGLVELYLPWPSFEANARHPTGTSNEFVLERPSAGAHEMAAGFHPAWSRLSSGVRHLHARNCHQVLGCALDAPARFVLCWTPDGSLDGRGQRVGGTGQALRIAHHHRVPVFNLARPEHLARVRGALVAH